MWLSLQILEANIPCNLHFDNCKGKKKNDARMDSQNSVVNQAAVLKASNLF